MVGAVRKAHFSQYRFGFISAIAARSGCIPERELDVFQCCCSGKEIEVLKDEADFTVPGLCELITGKGLCVVSIEDIMASSWRV